MSEDEERHQRRREARRREALLEIRKEISRCAERAFVRKESLYNKEVRAWLAVYDGMVEGA